MRKIIVLCGLTLLLSLGTYIYTEELLTSAGEDITQQADPIRPPLQ